jgi:hypothetical protein
MGLFVTENLKVADELQYKKTFLGLDDLEEDVLQTSFGKSLLEKGNKILLAFLKRFCSTQPFKKVGPNLPSGGGLTGVYPREKWISKG